MIVELYAKKIGQRGHVYLNNIELPEGSREYVVPVRPRLDIRIKQGEEIAPVTVSESARVFVWQYDPLNPYLDTKVRFLEK